MRRHLHMQSGAAGWPHLSPAARDEAAAAARDASQLAEKAAELAAAQVQILPSSTCATGGASLFAIASNSL